MELLVVNSNTSVSITGALRLAADDVADPSTKVTAVTAPFGPPAIETPDDVAIAAEATKAAIIGHPAPVECAVIACFSDPGLFEIRAAVGFPVVGIAEAAMFTAAMLGARFSILTVAPSAVESIRRLVGRYGMTARLAGIHALEMSVLESHGDPARMLAGMTDCARRAVDLDGAEVLILGGAVAAGMSGAVAAAVRVPVLDGLDCAVRQAELLHRIRSRTGG